MENARISKPIPQRTLHVIDTMAPMILTCRHAEQQIQVSGYT